MSKTNAKKMFLLTVCSALAFLAISFYYAYSLSSTSYLGIRIAKVNESWQVKKIKVGGSAWASELAVGDRITQIDNQPVAMNQLATNYLIVEQAEQVTAIRGADSFSLAFQKNDVNLQRFGLLFLVSLLGFYFLFQFVKKRNYSKYSMSFYYLVLLCLFSAISVVPSSISNFLGRTLLILFLSLFPIFLNLFLNQRLTTKHNPPQRRINRALLGLAIFNGSLWISRLFPQAPYLVSEYLSLGIFYSFAVAVAVIGGWNVLLIRRSILKNESNFYKL